MAKRTPDNLRSEDSLEIILGLCEGPIKGPKNGPKSIYLGDTPIENADGSSNFGDFEVRFYPGEVGEKIEPVFGGIANSLAVSGPSNLEKNVAVTRTTVTKNIDFLELRFVVQALYHQDKKGNLKGDTIQLKIEYKPTDSSTWLNPALEQFPAGYPNPWSRAVLNAVQNIIGSKPVNTDGIIRINGKTTLSYVKEIRFPVPRIDDTYDIRVTLLNDAEFDDGDTEIKRMVAWESIQEIIQADWSFPNTSVLHLNGEVTDQISSVPNVWGEYQGRILKVPTLYDGENRTMAPGLWDGLFKLQYTNNPAWILYDFVQDETYGLNSFENITLDKWDVLEAQKYCDELVPDGRGGTHPRWSFNGVIAQPMSGKELARYIAGSFNGVFHDDGNGRAYLKLDRNDPAVHLFTPENVIDGIFDYSFTDITTRYNDVTAVFINPELKWEQDRRRVVNQDHIDRYGRIATEFVAVGCTDPQQALRMATHRLITATTECAMVSFRTNRLGCFVSPFDIILIADPDLEFGQTGRINSHLGTTVELNDPVLLEPGIQYRLTFQVPNPNYSETTPSLEPTVDYRNPFMLIERTVTTVVTTPGSFSTLTIDAPLPESLPERANFALEFGDPNDANPKSLPKPYRVMSVNEVDGEPDNIRITAIELNRAKYDMVDNVDPDMQTPTYSVIVDPVIHAPLNPKITKEVEEVRGEPRVNLLLEWQRNPANNPLQETAEERFDRPRFKYRVFMSRNDGPRQIIYEGTDTRTQVLNSSPGDYVFDIYTVYGDNISKPARLTFNQLDGTEPAPAGVTGLTLVGEANRFDYMTRSPLIRWNKVTNNAELDHYEVTVRKAAGGAILRVEVVHENQYRYEYQDNILDTGLGPTRNLIFEVRVVNVSGVKSDPATLEIDNGLPSVPSDITINNVANYADIKFTPPSEDDWLGVYVWVDTAPIGTNPSVDDAVYRGSQSSIQLAGTNGVTYFMRLGFYDSFDPRQYAISSQFVVTIDAGSGGTDTIPPADIDIDTFSAYATALNVFLEWENPSDQDLKHIEIWEHTSDTADPLLEATFIATTPSNSYVRGGVPVGETRYYWLRAVDFSGNKSNFTGPKSTTTQKITETQIAEDSISTPHLKAGAVTSDKVQAGAIEGDHIKANTTLTQKLHVGTSFTLDGSANTIYQWNSLQTVKLFESTEDGVTIRHHDGTIMLDTSGGLNAKYIDGYLDWETQIGGAGKPESGADVTAKHAILTVENPEFEAGEKGWDLGTGWSIVNDPANSRTGGWCAKATSVADNVKLSNKVRLQVQPGDRVLAQGFAKVSSGGVWVMIRWRDAAGNHVNYSIGNAVTSSTYEQSRVVGVAPTGAATAEFVFEATANGTTGYVDGAYMGLIPRDADIDILQTKNAVAILDDLEEALEAANEAKATADGKIDVFFQSGTPTGSVGDMWFNTSTNKWFRHDGNTWVLTEDAGIGQAINAASTAEAKADGKVTSFYSATEPTAEAIGDLWFNTDTSVVSRWNGTSWNTIKLAAEYIDGYLNWNTQIKGLRPDDQMVDNMVYASAGEFLESWESFHTAGVPPEEIFVMPVEDAPGGVCLRFGNNSGNDAWNGNTKAMLPYDPYSLYEVGIVVRRRAGNGTLYMGVQGVAADRETLINTQGADNVGSQHYFAAAAASPGSDLTVFKGYFSGHGTPAGGVRTDPTNPGRMYPGVAYVRPTMFLNYQGAAGIMEVAAVWLRRLPGGLSAVQQINSSNIGNVMAPNTIPSTYIQSVLAEKIVAANLRALAAQIGSFSTASSGQRVVITDSLIQVYDSSNRLRVRMGIW